ncbi:unnamed protein product [Acanthoscelides obtectus]|uniref:Fatty acyl-CoA reductase n=2 Tax=Acanthoscelides obtectus TaxID=200917 RepID=A0A9P0NX20_ACAOB|nr:unnamed protein product [Acanthoscelides obtectus]CAK1663439.1 Fatty acyl-CoA reductase wat [Acanthoscelides obtectus]
MTVSDTLHMDNSTLPELNSEHDQQCLTPIQDFYKDTNIFITGSTGFLGKILIEKLLRSCKDVSTLYLLVRSKKGKNVHTRVEEIFDDIIFERLRKECPKFRHKVVGIAGDCTLPDLGLSIEDRKLLMDKVNVVFHVAATVRFDEKLNIAVAINVRAGRDLLQLAREMKDLKSFIHVSTAFSNCAADLTEEKFYEPVVDYKKVMMMAESLPEKMLDKITPVILDKFPNTYAFTKHVAEDVVRAEGIGLPVGIVRPSIVVSTYKEPIPAWINNMYGATGVFAGAAVGLLKVLYCDKNCTANIVPVDMVVNSVIASGWEIGTEFQKNKNAETKIYNYESSNDNPITWEYYMAKSGEYGMPTPSLKAVWYYSFFLTKSRLRYLFTIFFLHTVPAFLIDGVLLCIGKSPKMVKAYSKIHKFGEVISYFSIRTFYFKSQNIRKMLEKMTPKDRSIFFCDLKSLNWDEFFKMYGRGVRVHLLQDPMDTVDEARKKWRRLYWIHQTVKAVFVFLLLRMLWSIYLCFF